MSQARTRATTPDELPAEWYCRECAALRPKSAFHVRRRIRSDGSSCYTFEARLCRAHQQAYWRRWNMQVRRARASVTQPRPPGRPAHGGLSAGEWAHYQTRRQARAANVQRYVATLWEQTPAWLLGRERSQEQVEARALVLAILYDVHGFAIREAARAIARDRTTALYLLARYRTRPEVAELVGDYRHWRAQRSAARVAARKAG